LGDRICRATIPRQSAGAVVKYRVEANDTLENVLVAEKSYPVKDELILNLTLAKAFFLGENVTVRGNVTPATGGIPITILFISANGSKQIVSYTKEDGTFTAGFKPENLGTWRVQASFDGNAFLYESESLQLMTEVVEPTLFMKYSLYIGGGVSAAIMVVAVVFWRRSKG
jgi:hypothetical protein